MKQINVLGIALSSFAIGAFLVDGVVGNEPIWIGFNCVLIGVNFALWKSK